MAQIVTRFSEPYRTTVAITIGRGLELAVKESSVSPSTPRLVITLPIANESVDIGQFTKNRIDELCKCLQSLKIHAF